MQNNEKHVGFDTDCRAVSLFEIIINYRDNTRGKLGGEDFKMPTVIIKSPREAVFVRWIIEAVSCVDYDFRHDFLLSLARRDL